MPVHTYIVTEGWVACAKSHKAVGAASRSQSAPHMHVLECICSNVRQFNELHTIHYVFNLTWISTFGLFLQRGGVGWL